jgi:hypothetical protein
MVEHGSRWLLDRRAVQLELLDDVLCVNLRGRITAWRLRVIANAALQVMQPHDCGSILVNVLRARLALEPEAFAWVWAQPSTYPLSARYAAVIFDARNERTKWLLRTAGNILGSRWPGHLLELFDVGSIRAANHWADRHAAMFRVVQAEREARVAHRGR